jgi:hypothetical protein
MTALFITFTRLKVVFLLALLLALAVSFWAVPQLFGWVNCSFLV